MACWHLTHNFWILFQQARVFFHSKRSSEYFWGHRYLDAKLGAYIFHIIQVLPLPVINNATLGAQQATPVHLIMRPLLVTAIACTNIEDDFSHSLLPLGLELLSGGPNDNEVRKLEARRWQQSRTHRDTQEAPMSRTHICIVTSSGSAAGSPSCLGGGTLVLG